MSLTEHRATETVIERIATESRVTPASLRTTAEVQTFPSSFTFEYTNVVNGYKMVGNAVPVKFAEHLANAIYKYLAPLTAADLTAKSKAKPGKKTTKF